jgi:hypothetical protein
MQRLRFPQGQFTIPDNFDRIGKDEIARLFDGDPE